jgi:polysaccharide biosynthesis/export protein
VIFSMMRRNCLQNQSLKFLRVFVQCTALLMPILLATVLPQTPAVAAAPPAANAQTTTAADARRLLQLGPGDSVSIQVYGQPDMSSTEYVADDGTINVALVGRVPVSGLSPVEAGERVAQALTKGQYLVDPHVTIQIQQSKSQRVIVLGEVRAPGRYVVDPNSSILDLLAQAGGVTDKGADTGYVQRTDAQGNVTRLPVDLKGLSAGSASISTLKLQGGDSVYVPRADQYYIYGEVTAPNMYRLEPGMTVIEAVARAGGVTVRGSERRIEIKRAGKDGKYEIIHAKPDDHIAADDVIRVKEAIF